MEQATPTVEKSDSEAISAFNLAMQLPPSINYHAYTNDVKKTEAPLPEIFADKPSLIAVLRIAVKAGELVDLMKKGAVYGKEVNYESFSAIIEGLEDNIDAFDKALFRDVPDDYNGELIAVNPRIFHAAIGKFGESAELIEAVLKQAEGGKLDLVNVAEEAGDDQWYTALLIDEIVKQGGPGIGDIMFQNIAKLKKRYPEKFTLEQSENRDVAGERKVLQATMTSQVAE
jgi:NTP pyrophosphatase (non-canonical NTP hydrolase)